jgi:O-antigen/teichoic acid export membrane protein
MLTQRGIGLWQVASAVATVMQFVGQAVSQHLYSSTAKAPAERSQLIFRSYVRAVTITAAAALVGIPVLPLIVPFLYGKDFAVAVTPAVLVMGASVVAAGGSTLQAGARAMLEVKTCVWSEVLGIVAMAAVAWPAVEAWGEVGLALAYLAGRIMVLAAMTAASPRLFGITFGSLVPCSPRFLKSVGAEVRPGAASVVVE